MNLLSNCGLVVTLEVVLDHVVGPHVDADLVGADGPLEGRPTAVAVEGVVALQTLAAVEAGLAPTLAHTAHAHPVEAPRLLGDLAHKVDRNAVEDEGAHTAHIAVRVVPEKKGTW